MIVRLVACARCHILMRLDAPLCWRCGADARHLRQLECVRAHVAEGTMKAAAYRLGLSPMTVRTHLAGARDRLGVETTEQAVYLLTVRGELVLEDWRGE